MDSTPTSYIVDLGRWDFDPTFSVETALSDAELDLLCDLAPSEVDRLVAVTGLKKNDRSN